MSRKIESRKVAAAMCSSMVKRTDELLQKPKLTADERKELRRFRQLASLVVSLGV